MTTTTSETLKLNNLVLNTLGYNIDLWTSTMGTHSRVPRNTIVPRRPGAIRRRPKVSETALELSMWVSSRDANGVPGGTTQLWTNLDVILEEVGPVANEVTLTKIRQSASGAVTLTLDTDVVGPIEWEQMGPEVLMVRVPMIAAYPFWSGVETDQNIAGASGTITNNGHTEALDITLTLEAGGTAWTNPSVENVTSGVTLDYTGTVPANDTFSINLWDGTAVDDLGASVAGGVSVNGNFFPLAVGDNTINVTETAGGGTFRTVFRPPYLG